MISFKSSSRFPLSSGARVASPVIFPPGRARLATNPLPTGSLSCAMTMGIVTVASLAARVDGGPFATMMSTFESHEFGRERGETVEFSLRVSILNDDISPLHVAKLAEALPECLDAVRDTGKGGTY